MDQNDNTVRFRLDLDESNLDQQGQQVVSVFQRWGQMLQANLSALDTIPAKMAAIESLRDRERADENARARLVAQQAEMKFNAENSALQRIDAAREKSDQEGKRRESARARWVAQQAERKFDLEKSYEREVQRINAETHRQHQAQLRLQEHAERELGEARVRINRVAMRQQGDDTIRELGRIRREQQQQSSGSGIGSNILAAAGLGGGVAGIAFTAVSSVVNFITRSVREGISAWFEYSAHIEQVRIGFTTMLGSGQAAEAMIKNLSVMARTTPFEFEGLADATRRLLALGTASRDVLPLLKAIGNATSAAGGGQEQFQRVVYAFGDIQAKGKLTGEEIRQLANNGIPVFRILQEELQLTNGEIFKLVRQSKLGSEEFIEAFKRFSENKFGDAMQAQSRTALGALSNLKDAALQISDNALKPLFNLIRDGLVSSGEYLVQNQNAWEAWGSSIAKSVANTLSRITSLISGIKNINDEISPLRFLPESARNEIISSVPLGFLPLLLGGERDTSKPSSAAPPGGLPPIFGNSSDPYAMLKDQGLGTRPKGVGPTEETKALWKKMEKMYTDLLVDVELFGNKGKVAEVKRKLIDAGADLKSDDAKELLKIATELDSRAEAMKAAQKAAKGTPWTLSAMVEFIRGQGMEVISTTGGTHNNGSAHYDGRAADVRTRDRSPLEIARFVEAADQAGLRVRDERTRPQGQEVWGGPHLHLSFKRGDKRRGPGYAFDDGGLVEDPQDVQNRIFLSAMSIVAAKYNATTPISTGSDGTIDALVPTEVTDKKSERQARFDDMSRASNERRDDYLHDAANLAGILQIIEDDAFIDRLERIQEYTIRATQAEEAYGQMIAENGDIAATAERRRAKVAEERLDLTHRIAELEDEIATSGANAALVYEEAWLDAIRQIQRADEEARVSIIKSQVAISDQSVFHADRTRAQIMDHVANAGGITEIFADSVTSAMDAISDGWTKLFSKVNEGLGEFGNWITKIQASLMSMVTNRLLMRLVDMLLGPAGGGGQASGGGIGGLSLPAPTGNSNGGGGIFSTIFRGIFGGGIFGNGGGGGSANASASATANGGVLALPGVIKNLTGFGGGNNVFTGLGLDGLGLFGNNASGSSATISSGADQAAMVHGAIGDILGKATSNATAPNPALFGGKFAGLSSMLPFLGLSLGAGLGQGSVPGTIMGAAGGLLLGGVGAAALGGLSGIGIGSFAALGALGPIALVAAPLLLLGGWLLGRNSRRRKEEEMRDDAMVQSLNQLDKIRGLVESHKLDGAEGVAQALDVRRQYVDAMSQLKDSKTRNIALKDVYRLDLKIDQIKKAATTALNDNNRDRLLIPEFATGGIVPGPFGSPRLVVAHGGERFLGLNETLRTEGPTTVSSGNNGGGQNINLNVELSLGTDTQNRLFVNGAESDAGYKVTVKTIEKHNRYDRLQTPSSSGF